MGARAVYGFFPYLRTNEGVRVRGVHLRSTQDLSGLTDEDRAAVGTLGGMFVEHDGSPIGDMVYLVATSSSGDRIEEDLGRQLSELQLLVSYVYTGVQHTGDPFLSAEHASLFVFRREEVPAFLPFPGRHDEQVEGVTSSEFLDAYHGVRNWDCHFWAAEGSKVFPEFPHFYRNDSQTLAANLADFTSRPHNWALARLFQGDGLSPETRERMFVALKWYAASCRFATDEAEKLVFLAVALESLLKVREGEGLTERFKDAVVTLLGPVPRLDSWLDQFYHERSKTVHEGRPHRLSFFAADRSQVKQLQKGARDGTPHGSLLAYGRRIFRLCLNGILTGATLAEEAGLAALFVPNSERLASVSAILAAGGSPPEDRLCRAYPLMAELCSVGASPNESLGYGVELEQAFGVARVALATLRDASPKLPPEAAALLAAAAGHTGGPTKEQYERLVRLSHLLREGAGPRESGLRHEATLGVSWLLSFLSSQTFRGRVERAERSRTQ